MSRLALYLLGPPRLERDGEPLQFDTRKIIALVAYLAVAGPGLGGQPHTRESLITLLWPELEPSRARAVLRRNLSLLRKALDGEWLVVEREIVHLDPETDVWIDVAQFRSLLQVCKGHDHPEADVCSDCLAALTEAVELYQGDFLAGFTLRDSVNFDEFQFFQTEELRRELASALERLVRGRSAQGAYEAAISYVRRWLALDPLHEPVHRCLMELYAQAGQRSAALRQYEECVRILQEELGLLPAEETTSLYEQIRTGIVEGERPLTTAVRPRHNLPTQVTPFIGREDELAAIKARLKDPDCRLLTLVGPGGSGKTRLALEAAAAQLDNFEHGVFFISLAPLQSVDGIVPTVAQAVGFSLYGGSEPEQQLLDYLRKKHMLIIMDNYEHLLPPSVPPGGGERGGGKLVTDVLKMAPGVKILATSRARLNVGGEHRFQISGMDVPDSDTWEHAADYSAVRLFLQGARRARASFDPSADNLKHISRVCRLVEGMPLAIRLAAAWVAMLSPEEIAAQIAGDISQSLDLLTTERHDVPERQRSVRAVFDHSWNLLTEQEREVFQGLAIFRGGFTQEAAHHVTGASLRDLMALVDKSLMHRAPTGRYEIHELLRQYAEEKLDQEPAAGEAARDRHSAYYAAALAQWEADLKGPRQQAVLVEMDAEIENARTAWEWAAEQVQVERLDRAVEGLCLFYERRSRFLEGEAACRMAASKLAATVEGLQAPCPEAKAPPLFRDPESLGLATRGGTGGLRASGQGASGPQGLRASCPEALVLADKDRAKELRVWAKVLAWQAFFDVWLGRFELARQLAQQSMVLLEEPALADQDTQAEKAFALCVGGGAEYGSDREECKRLFEQSLALYHALGDRWRTAFALLRAGSLATGFGDYDKGKQLLEESLAIRQSLDDQHGIAESLVELGLYSRAQGQLAEAERLYRESLAIFQKMGDRGEVAGGLIRLGEVLFELGKFAEGCSLMEESLAIHDGLGHINLAFANVVLGEAKAYLGQYEQARALGQRGLAVYRETDQRWGIGFSHYVLGLAAVAEEAHAEAHQLLQGSVSTLREFGLRENMSWALAVLSYAACGLGQLPQARQHLHEALQTAAEIGTFKPFMLGLSAVALLLADRGQVERAVELYALASRYPFVANSRWFEDVAGRHIEAVAAATLPPEVVAAAQERGRARDLDATVAELLVELEGEL